MRFQLGAGAVLAALAVAPLALAVDFGRPGELRVGAQPADVTTFDVNEDGHPDVITAHASPRGVSVVYGRENGFGPMTAYPATGAVRGLAVLNANDDGYQDLALARAEGDRVTLLLGNGSGFVPGGSFAVGSSPYAIAADDVSGDGHMDLVTGNVGVGRPYVSVLLGRGDGTFEDPVGYQTETGSYSVALTDLDGDSSLDIVSTNSFSNTLSFLFGNGDGTFQEPARISHTVGSRPRFVRAIEGGDGPELYVASLGTTQGAGSGIHLLRTWSGSSIEHAILGGPAWVTVDDLDGDALTDIVATVPSKNEVAVIPGDRYRIVRFPVGRLPGAAAVDDLNGDGTHDLAVANRGSGTVSVLLNGTDAGGRRTTTGCAVPRLALKTLAQARSTLHSALCTLGRVSRKHSRFRRGRVIAQRPRAGTQLPSGASVALVVSRGPRR